VSQPRGTLGRVLQSMVDVLWGSDGDRGIMMGEQRGVRQGGKQIASLNVLQAGLVDKFVCQGEITCFVAVGSFSQTKVRRQSKEIGSTIVCAPHHCCKGYIR
jgi:hypothetical protein